MIRGKLKTSLSATDSRCGDRACLLSAKKEGGEAHPVPVILSPKGVEMFRVNHFGCVTSVFAVAISQFICIFAHC